MNCGGQIKKVICSLNIGVFLFINTSLLAQMYENNLSENYSNLYGGRTLLDNQFTVGGRKLKNIQPQYGGQRIDEKALYNPHLDDAFDYMGKPLFSPNPYSYPRLVNPYIYNPQTRIEQPTITSFNPYVGSNYPISPQSNVSVSQKQQKETASISPIIPAIIGAIDAMYRENKDEKEGFSGYKRLSLDGWYGDIRATSKQSGRFSFRNTSGETVSGTYSMVGSRINFNINHYGKEKTEYWEGSSYQWGSGSNINVRSSIGSITGSSSSFGDSYRYRFNTPNPNYEVEIRDTSKTSQSIRVRGNNIYQYGYIN